MNRAAPQRDALANLSMSPAAVRDDDRPSRMSPPSTPSIDAPAPPREASFASPELRARHDGWTAMRQAVFLAALGNGAAIAAAANAAGMSRESAYRLRRNPRATDFAARWAAIDATARVGLDLATLLDDGTPVAARVARIAWLDARATRPRFDDWLVWRMATLQKQRREP